MPPGFPLNRDFPINSIAVVIGYKTEKGIQEVVHQLDGEQVRIVSFTHDVQTKMRAVKEDGQMVGHEPTGEEIVIIKIKYIRE
jgi:hypothetical protein